jgi:peptide/nickel transport system substrate-binding protein
VKRFPFDSKVVRQAFAYSIDRKAIVEELFGPLGVDEPANSLNPYILREYSDQDAFKKYERNLDKVDELMSGDGWKKGSDGIWAKGGKKAQFAVSTTAGNKQRELMEEVMQTQLKSAGFKMDIKNTSSTTCSVCSCPPATTTSRSTDRV